jgi:hypothetical protein
MQSTILKRNTSHDFPGIIVPVKSEISKWGSMNNRIPLQEDGQRKIVITVSISKYKIKHAKHGSIPFGMHKCNKTMSTKLSDPWNPFCLQNPQLKQHIWKWLSMWFFFSVVASMRDKGCWRLSFTYKYAHTLQHFDGLTLVLKILTLCRCLWYQDRKFCL